jgi:hypothetical protein
MCSSSLHGRLEANAALTATNGAITPATTSGAGPAQNNQEDRFSKTPRHDSQIRSVGLGSRPVRHDDNFQRPPSYFGADKHVIEHTAREVIYE